MQGAGLYSLSIKGGISMVAVLHYPKELGPTLKLSIHDLGVVLDAVDYSIASGAVCRKTIFLPECVFPETGADSIAIRFKTMREKIVAVFKSDIQYTPTLYELLVVQCLLKEIDETEDVNQRKQIDERLTFEHTDREQVILKIHRFFESVTLKIQ